MQAFGAQLEVPSALIAEAAVMPDRTCMTVSAFTQLKVMVVPAPNTFPAEVTSVRPLTVAKVATAPGATGIGPPASMVTLNAPPEVWPGTNSPRTATNVRSCIIPTRMLCEGKTIGSTVVPW